MELKGATADGNLPDRAENPLHGVESLVYEPPRILPRDIYYAENPLHGVESHEFLLTLVES